MPLLSSLLAVIHRAAFLGVFCVFASAVPLRAQTLEGLDFQTSTGTRHFEVEVMRTNAEHEKGLMYRRFLPADRGMLFLFDDVQMLYFWMKNTYIPLDIIFVGKDGKIVSIARDTETLSEKIIPSGGPANAVVEINGGAAKRLGIEIGDLMVFPALSPSPAH